MPIVAVGSAEVAVAEEHLLVLYGLDGRVHHTVPAEDIDAGVFLPDGRLLVFGGGRAWVLKEGAVEREIDTDSQATEPQLLESGLVFDGIGNSVTWIDPDTGEVATIKTEHTNIADPSGRRIDGAGLAAPGAGFVWPAELPAGPTDCRLVPGDDRAWCATSSSETCEILGFTFDGRLAGRVPGCTIEAVGPRSLVVEDHDEDVWIGLDDGVRATFRRATAGYRVGEHALAATDGREAFVFVDGTQHKLERPGAAPPPPPGINVTGGTTTALLDPEGRLLQRWIGSQPRATTRPAPRARARAKDGVLTVSGSDGKQIFQVADARASACAIGDELAIVRGKGTEFSAWDLETGTKRWSVRTPGTGPLCRVVGRAVVVSGEGREWAYNADTGRLVTESMRVSVSPDGRVFARNEVGATTFVGVDGKVLGGVPMAADPVALVGGTVIITAKVLSGSRTLVAGVDASGVRWERLTTAPPTIDGDHVYLISGGEVVAVDAQDGHTLWTSAEVANARSVSVTP